MAALTSGLAACGEVATLPLPPVRATSPRVEAIADISRRVRQLAGTGLRECGEHMSGDGTVTATAVLRAVDCGRASINQREPFWLAFENPADINFHSIRAQGLFAGRDGVPFQFTYERTFSLRGVRPALVVSNCPRPSARGIGLSCR